MRQRPDLRLSLLVCVCACALLTGCSTWEERARAGLQARNALQRRETLEDLKDRPTCGVRKDLERVLSTDLEPANRALAADVLGLVGMQESLGELRISAGRDRSPLVRKRALRALARIQVWRSGADLRVALGKDADPGVRVEAINLACRFLQPKAAAEVALEGLKDKDKAVQVTSYHSLCRLTGRDLPPSDQEGWAKVVGQM